MTYIGHRLTFVIFGLLALLLSGCSTMPDTAEKTARNDPFEDANRAIFAFNLKVDDYALEPAAKALQENIARCANRSSQPCGMGKRTQNSL